MTDAKPRGEAKLRMRRLVGWGVIGQLAYIISQLILLIALARLASVDEVGSFGFASAIIIPIFFFFNLGLRVNQATDIAREYNFREFLALRIITTSIGYVIILLAAIFLLDPATRTVTLVFGAAKAVETFSELFYGFFQRAEKLRYVARSLALRGFGSAALFTAALSQTGDVATAFLAHLVVWFLVALFIDYLPARRLAARAGEIGKIRPRVVLQLAWSSLPLGVNALMAALQGSLPRYIIGWMIGIAALGQFTVVSYAMQAIVTITTAISNSIASRLAFYVSVGNRTAFFRVFKHFIALIAAAGVIGAVASLIVGDWLLRTVFGPDYSGLGVLFAICVVSAALRACVIIVQAGLFAAREFYLSMVIRAFSLVLMLITCLAGTWAGGLIGLSWGMALTFLVHSVVLWLVLQRIKFPELETKIDP